MMAQTQSKKYGDNIGTTYHTQLDTVLEMFWTAGPCLRNVVLPIGHSKLMVVDVVACFQFIIQGMQEGEMLCSRYRSHTGGI